MYLEQAAQMNAAVVSANLHKIQHVSCLPYTLSARIQRTAESEDQSCSRRSS